MDINHRDAVGGMWDEIGQLQLNFLKAQGVRPKHRLLDVGCGSLRAGVFLVPYLEDGHYYGIDKQQWLLDAAREVELPRYDAQDRVVHLLCDSNFAFSRFGTTFDIALAQSVFTHLTWNSILRCLANLAPVLEPDGRFFATFFEDSQGAHYTTPQTHEVGSITTYPDMDPYHYQFDVFQDLARRTGLKADYIGDWNHPRNQKMMVFRRS